RVGERIAAAEVGSRRVHDRAVRELAVAVPCVGTVTMDTDNGSPSASRSLANTSTVTAVSSSVDAESSATTGSSFTAFTVMVTVRSEERRVGKETRYVNESSAFTEPSWT